MIKSLLQILNLPDFTGYNTINKECNIFIESFIIKLAQDGMLDVRKIKNIEMFNDPVLNKFGKSGIYGHIEYTNGDIIASATDWCHSCMDDKINYEQRTAMIIEIAEYCKIGLQSRIKQLSPRILKTIKA